jgi:hypothetical protein
VSFSYIVLFITVLNILYCVSELHGKRLSVTEIHKSLAFFGTQNLLPCSTRALCYTHPYPEANKTSPCCPSIYFLRSILILLSHVRLGCYKWSLSMKCIGNSFWNIIDLPYGCCMHRLTHPS